MAQKMIDEKVRVVESGPEPLQSQLRDLEQDADTDVESIGSQDTETSESEEELEVLPPSKKARKPRGKSSLDSTKTQAEQRRRKRKPQKETTATATPSNAENERPRERKRQNRGRYRSWARYRVVIHKALVDAVFDRVKAAEFLKKTHKLYVPSSVLGYYSRKLSPSAYSFCSSASTLQDSELD
ncbi:22kDa protein [Southern Psittacara leucophthalmus aviadenovirus]|uniref:22kDa protein n=1 Tax=Southern Psittacara leucophthalmus aviadenovirus TaxID=2604330 RepID=A0AAE6IR03_9ADEN|nr:22kDa protein [Southern Psittacara leucophthalmus aviadenovirus]QEJ80778.1 22kDa protein [Southern Psittacara leucophthalmus aviadenovirus]